MAHYKPHVHEDSPIDIAVKSAAVGGVLEMVRRERSVFAERGACLNDHPNSICDGLPYEFVPLITSNLQLSLLAAHLENTFSAYRHSPPTPAPSSSLKLPGLLSTS
jgi:hypothetical protein